MLRDVTFETAEGEFLTLIGPSGCGKTTLLKTIAGLVTPNSGTVQGIPFSNGPDGRALVVFQENSLFPWLTVLENAVFGLEMQGAPKAERESRALEFLERYHLREFAKAYPCQLSAGMKQRVAVIRAFLSNPSVLLMDEPFAALDSQTRFRLQVELLSMLAQQRKAVVFVTHDLDEAILLSDRILVLTPRPATVAASYSVDIPHERRSSLRAGERFLALKRQLARDLGLVLEESAHAG